MNNLDIPENIKGKELYNYLIANKTKLIKAKKSIHNATKNSQFPSVSITGNKNNGTKSFAADSNEDNGVVRVKVIANTALWFDEDQDVLMPDNWKRSINQNKNMMVHLRDHIFTLDAKVGEVVDVYSQDIPIRELGFNKDGTTQCLVFVTDIYKDYNEKIYNMYKKGKINQHSIGFKYVIIELAINDEEYVEEYKLWKSVIDRVINKEYAEEYGYMWVVREIKLIENSAVLMGANVLTPTQDNNYSNPSNDTLSNTFNEGKFFDMGQAIKSAIFIN